MSTTSGKRLWLEEEIESDLRWSYSVKQLLHAEVSAFQDVELLETGPFGKVLLLDGKLQSAEADERVYHECLVHAALLHHPCPKKVFICGGGEGSTAREVLKHKSVEKVIMVDIDKVVCDFCEKHLDENKATFTDSRLELIIDDAKAQLENQRDGEFDVIIGDLADPVFGGPCYQLYTQEFYNNIVKAKLAKDGIFVTQSGPAGVLAHKDVFVPINRTLSSVFESVVPYVQHIPSFADCWGWNMAFKATKEKTLSAEEFDKCIEERIEGGADALTYLDGHTWIGITKINKLVRKSFITDSHILTVGNPRFIHGQGVKTIV